MSQAGNRENVFVVEVLMPLTSEGPKAALPSLGRASIELTRVPLEMLTNNLQEFIKRFQMSIDTGDLGDSEYVLDEIELSLELTATGGVALIGKMEAGANAAIKVKLKRKTP
jgi:hypothetical protein